MRRVVRAVLLSALLARVVHAQSTSASLTGRITDPHKAVISDAKVTAINTGTEIHYHGLTNETGTYYISNPVSYTHLDVYKRQSHWRT